MFTFPYVKGKVYNADAQHAVTAIANGLMIEGPEADYLRELIETDLRLRTIASAAFCWKKGTYHCQCCFLLEEGNLCG